MTASRQAARFIAALIGGAVLSAALRARIAEMAPAARRGAAYGIFNTAYGVLWFAGSSAIGILYARSLALTAGFAMAAQLAAMPVLWLARRKHA